MKFKPSPLVFRRVFSFLLLGLMFLGLAIMYTPEVNALLPTITQEVYANTTANVSTLTTGAFTPTNAGDILILSTQIGSLTTGITVTSVVDSLGGTYSKIGVALNTPGPSSLEQQANIYMLTSSVAASQTVTVTISATLGAAACCSWAIEIIELTNAGTTVVCTATFAATASYTSFGTSPSCPFASGNVAIASLYASGGTLTAGTSYTKYSGAGGSGLAVEYSATLTAGSSTAFPWTATATSGIAEFGMMLGASTLGGQSTQTVGSCPAKNTAVFTPANSTIYLYTGNALGSEVVNTISTEVASVTSGTHTLQLLLYVSTAPTVSAISPLNLAFSKSFSVTTGSTNQLLTAQVNIQLGGLSPIGAGNTWAVGLVADDHFRINQSSLTGLSTLAGAASTATQPSSFSNTGAASGSKIFLCAVASYQNLVTTTTTTTAAATTTVTTSTTSTILTFNLQAGALVGTNLVVLIVVLFGPAIVTAGVVGVTVRSASAAGIGFIAGLALGAGIGFQAGIIPLSLVFLAILVMIFMFIGVFLYVRGSGG